MPTTISTPARCDLNRPKSPNYKNEDLSSTCQGNPVLFQMFAVDLAKKYAFESLEIIVNKAEKLGVRLCLENMTPQCRAFFKPDEFEEIFKKFPSLYMTFDTGHANIDCKEEKRGLNFIHKFKHRVLHIHVSDNKGKKDDHLPIGQGNIDFQEITRSLINIGYNDTVTLEIFTENRQQDLLQTRRKFESMMRSE